MPPKYRQFASYVSSQRAERGLSQRELAAMVGVTRQAIFYWESGKVLPQANVLEPLARALGVSYEDLFALAGYAHPEGLPEPVPYLRAKYPGISKKAVAEAERLFADFDGRYKKGSADRKKGRRQ